MHITTVTMKDGRVFEGPIWVFRPVDGWLTLSCDDAPDIIYLRDIESAITEHERISVSLTNVRVDELEQARKYGWDDA